MDERIFDKVMNREFKLKGLSFKTVDLLFVLCIITLSAIIRIKLLPVKSGDYNGFLEGWMTEIRRNGGFKSLKNSISNYSSPYMYLMCLVSKLTTNDLYGLKIVSFVFDFFASVGVFLIVWNLTENLKKSIFGMSMLLLSPTVFINSAYWCQCDMIYTCFIIYALYSMFKKRSRTCLILVGIAFSFKLQTLLILPFLIIMWLKNNVVKFRHFIWIPLMYVIMHLPAFFIGRDFGELMNIYSDQASYYPWGTLNYPNMYYFMDETMYSNHNMDAVSSAGLFVCIALLGLTAYYLYTKKFKITKELMIHIAVFTSALCVYTLPHMHERYGFLIDVLLVILVAVNPKKIRLLVMYFLVSMLSYAPFLLGKSVIDLYIVAVLNGILLLYNLKMLINEIKINEINTEEITPEENE